MFWPQLAKSSAFLHMRAKALSPLTKSQSVSLKKYPGRFFWRFFLLFIARIEKRNKPSTPIRQKKTTKNTPPSFNEWNLKVMVFQN